MRRGGPASSLDKLVRVETELFIGHHVAGCVAESGGGVVVHDVAEGCCEAAKGRRSGASIVEYRSYHLGSLVVENWK